MTAGGAPGQEFGPFPQNIPRLKRRTTTHQSVTIKADPDFIWSRKNRLVKGTYEVSASLVQTSADAVQAVSITYQWLFSDADPAGVGLAMTGSTANLTDITPIQKAVKIISWVGDGNTQLQAPLEADDDLVSVRFAGVVFIPAPTDVRLGWAPTNPFPVNLLLSGLIRFALIR